MDRWRERAWPLLVTLGFLLLVFYFVALQPLADEVRQREGQLRTAREKADAGLVRFQVFEARRATMEARLRRLRAVAARQTGEEEENRLVNRVGQALAESGIRFARLQARRETVNDLGEMRLRLEMDFQADGEQLRQWFRLLRESPYMVLPEFCRFQQDQAGRWSGRLGLLALFRSTEARP